MSLRKQDRCFEQRYKSGMVVQRTKRASAYRAGFSLCLALLSWLLLVEPGIGHADPLLTYPIEIGKHRIRVELAHTPDTRQKGLMFRKRLGADSGMIFVFPRQQVVSMWMKNTFVPLSVAFIDKDGMIVNIEHMQPHDEHPHSSKRKVIYALEVNQGWFSSKGIEPGMQVSGLEKLPGAR